MLSNLHILPALTYVHPEKVLVRLWHAILEGQITFAQLLLHILRLAIVHHLEQLQEEPIKWKPLTKATRLVQ